MNFRFAVISDPHIAISETIRNVPNRFHLVEVSIPALELVLTHLERLDLDFLLLPGDLTQDGEPENHQWLRQRLEALPFPVYVVPGNHDVPTLFPTDQSIGLKDFPYYYPNFGYHNPQQLYYHCELLPGVQLIGLNSNQFNQEGQQIGYLDEQQLTWLEKTLAEVKDQLVMVMIHHNVIEHLPGQSHHILGRRYMLSNAPALFKLLHKYGVKLIFTGHLHVQDVAYQQGIYEITTGSLVSYPHPYRIIQVQYKGQKQQEIEVKSYRVNGVPGWPNLPEMSRQWLGDRSYPFMMKLLTTPPLNLSVEEAEPLTPLLRNFWADIAGGDAMLDFPEFPPPVRRYFQKFNAVNLEGKPHLVDNQTTLLI
ncbi:metallophosphoesterase family protein [Gloeothece verrucosa]|nr:metallophosphoesterase [Gloeothece verrucosa]